MNPQRIILQNIASGHEGIMTLPVLWSEVILDHSGMSYSEFKKHLTDLERDGEIIVVNGKDRSIAKITDKGRMRLMEP